MRYTKYSFRDLEKQDEYMWDAFDFELSLIKYFSSIYKTRL